MGFLKSFKKKKKEKDRAAEGGKASKKDQKPPRSPQLKKTTNAEPELARPAAAGNDAPTIVSSAHTSAENLPEMANPKHHDNDHSDNGGGMASAQSTVTIRAASDASDESRPTAAAAPTPLIANNGPALNKPSLRRSKSIVEFDKSEHKVLVPIETQLGKPIEKVYDGVHDGPELGTGITGVVRRVTHKKTQHEYAVKKLDLGKIKTEAELKQLREEVSYILSYICGGWVQIVRPCWATNAS